MITELQTLSRLALEEGLKYQATRDLFNIAKKDHGKVFLGIIGPRGSGKSVLLKQLLNSLEDSLYLSLDSFKGGDLFEIARDLSSNFNIKYLLLDEVHFIKEIDFYLKKIFDFLPIKIIFTSSVSLLMHQSAYDLSRRVKLINMPNFSFREYLNFTKIGGGLRTLSLDDIMNKELSSRYLMWEDKFDHYLKGGNLPISLEVREPLTQLQRVLDKVIQKDLPRVGRLTFDELDTIEKLVNFIGKSSIDGINPTSLSNNLKITKHKAVQYLGLLEQAFVLNIVKPTGTNVLKEPKITLSLPFRLLFSEYEASLGGLREDFCVEMLKNSGARFFYLKDNRGRKCPDYLIEDRDERYVIEVGGPNKNKAQFKSLNLNIDYQALLFNHGGSIGKGSRALSTLGFLY